MKKLIFHFVLRIISLFCGQDIAKNYVFKITSKINKVNGLVFTCCFLTIGLLTPVNFACSAKKEGYHIRKGKNNQVIVSNKAIGEYTFTGEFILISREEEPNLQMKNFTNYRYFSSSWEVDSLPAKKMINEKEQDSTSGGDGIDHRMSDVKDNRTFDLFYAGKNQFVVPIGVEQNGSVIRFIYPENIEYEFNAWIECPKGGDSPTIRYSFKPKQNRYYSVGYLGAPSFDPDIAEEFWQPMVWQQKRFPEQSYISLAYQCPIPATMVNVKGHTIGLIVPPSQFEFDPLPTQYNNTFGVALRNEEGKAQPMVFSPVLGSKGSFIKNDEVYSFEFKLFIENASLQKTFRRKVENEYNFSDYRSNALGPLNLTIDNMIDYALSPYSQFIDSLKGCSYSTDVPGSTKNVSTLHPLEIALVTDNEKMYFKRALPIMEYMLSRKNNLFCLDTLIKIQNPTRTMDGPCATYTELVSLYSLTNKSMPHLKVWADKKYAEESAIPWHVAMVAFQALQDKKYLDMAERGAEQYIKKNIDVLSSSLSSEFFWSSFAPSFMPLYEMYETTGNILYLNAARKAAYYYSMFIWFSPMIPQAHIVVNKGGKAPLYWYLASKGHKQMHLPEEIVPAWRTSEIGLLPESSTTSIGHRGVFMAHHAPFMMRIAANTNDSFMRNIARSAIIGRYANFPGYHINTERTTVYEKPDYPYKNHLELSYNSFHYNHIYPNISLLFDYLISDMYDRSNQNIDFPSFFIEGYAYLVNKFYGHEPGQFYIYNDVKLWMPQSLIQTESPELNYLSGRNRNDLFLSFTNQCNEDIESDVLINTDLLPQLSNKEYVAEVWIENVKSDNIQVIDGKFRLPVKSKGISAVVIKEVNVTPTFQDNLFDNTGLWSNGKKDIQTGDATAMVIDMGKGLKSIFIYLRENDETLSSAIVSYKNQSGKKITLTDNSYPYEFSIPLPDDAESFVFSLAIVDKNNKSFVEDNITLSK